MFKILLLAFFELALGLVLWIIFASIYHYFKTPKKSGIDVIYKESGFWDKILVQFPEMLGKTIARRDNTVCNETGFILFTGEQGSGKTCAMTHYINLLKAQYPTIKVQTNYGLIFEDAPLLSWRDIIGRKNGNQLYISAFDELSVFFNNRNFRNFDFNFFSTIVQNRKERRLILGTAQNISLCDKALRTQVTEIRDCSCFGGFVVFVHRFTPVFDTDGNIKRLRPRGSYFFIQSDFLRECYDTSLVLRYMGEIGYDEK